jgi:KUP system potassium uptake protein
MTQPAHSNLNNKHLILAALGVVFGDIGTSPLYAFKEAFSTAHNLLEPNHDNVLGILSLIVWTLLIIVTLKYVFIVLKADNHGEGGVVALMARLSTKATNRPIKKMIVVTLGILGAALFYGDGVITPAISVLSAVEGLEIVTPAFKPYTITITLIIIIGLFLVQQLGTARVGILFGPIVCFWFLILATVGLCNIIKYPSVLIALSPHHAVYFFWNNPSLGFFALSAVFLTVTGGEALYADMGHFGSKPIRLAWLYVVLPSLLLNYFGQGALIINNPELAINPFYFSFPKWAVIPMVFVSTAATVIASQALITGVFSVTRELIQLGYCPRLNIRHTSGSQMGQIYIPFINWLLLLVVIAVVLGFKTSSNLASAYGIAVIITMIITTLMTFSVVRRDWNWPTYLALIVFIPLICIELLFFSSNILKITNGGWFPLVFGALIYLVLTIWKSGKDKLNKKLSSTDVSLVTFLEMIQKEDLPKVKHTAVFFTANPESAPNALLHNLKHNFVLHNRMLFITVIFQPVPRIPLENRLQIETLANHMYRIKINFGFMEEPDVMSALNLCKKQGLNFNPRVASYFLSREILLPTHGHYLLLWRDHLFEFMFRNSTSVEKFFNLPANRVVELGSRITI